MPLRQMGGMETIGMLAKGVSVPLIFTVSVGLKPLARSGLSMVVKPQALTAKFLVVRVGYSTTIRRLAELR